MRIANGARPLRRRALLLIIAMLGLPPAAPAAAGPEDAVELVERINAERIDDDARPLRMCADLNEVARRWSEEMAEAGDSSHNPRREEQVSAWRVLAENVGVGDSAESVHESFMDSEGHRDNVLSQGFTEVGIGVVVDNDRTWVTELFRKPARSEPCVHPGAGGAGGRGGEATAHAGGVGKVVAKPLPMPAARTASRVRRVDRRVHTGSTPAPGA